MNRQKRADLIQTILEEHIPNPQIPLLHTSPYTLLIAVLLSAQCTDARVSLTAPSLFALADTPEKMARLTVPQIEAVIRPCGLGPRKAQAIWELSNILIHTHQSAVPNTLEELTQLPGVGRKTASVVLAQAFQIPAFPVDTHIHRCAQRWHLSSGKTVEEIEQDLVKLFPRSSWNKIHLQMILFARRFCPAKGHDPKTCPICSMLTSERISKSAKRF